MGEKKSWSQMEKTQIFSEPLRLQLWTLIHFHIRHCGGERSAWRSEKAWNHRKLSIFFCNKKQRSFRSNTSPGNSEKPLIELDHSIFSPIFTKTACAPFLSDNSRNGSSIYRNFMSNFTRFCYKRLPFFKTVFQLLGAFMRECVPRHNGNDVMWRGEVRITVYDA